MGKLLDLKAWLTLSEATRHLSDLLGEPVNEADILRLALDGHLVLSALFVNHTTARVGRTIPLAEADVECVPGFLGGEPFDLIKGLKLGDDQVVALSDDVSTLTGAWDLTMMGAERLDVEHRYQTLTGGPSLDLICPEGPLVRGDDGLLAQLVTRYTTDGTRAPLRAPWDRNHHSHFHPASGLPEDCVLVLTVNNLASFSTTLTEDKPKVRPLESRERTTLLVLIGALLRLAKLDPSRPSKTAGVIESETALMGARVSARAIEDHLKKVTEAIAARSD